MFTIHGSGSSIWVYFQRLQRSNIFVFNAYNLIEIEKSWQAHVEIKERKESEKKTWNENPTQQINMDTNSLW